MSTQTRQIVDMLDMLPEEERNFACEMLRKIVLAWDPDFTKLTPDEARRLEVGRQQIADGMFYQSDEIDWENLDNMNLN